MRYWLPASHWHWCCRSCCYSNQHTHTGPHTFMFISDADDGLSLQTLHVALHAIVPSSLCFDRTWLHRASASWMWAQLHVTPFKLQFRWRNGMLESCLRWHHLACCSKEHYTVCNAINVISIDSQLIIVARRYACCVPTVPLLIFLFEGRWRCSVVVRCAGLGQVITEALDNKMIQQRHCKIMPWPNPLCSSIHVPCHGRVFDWGLAYRISTRFERHELRDDD